MRIFKSIQRGMFKETYYVKTQNQYCSLSIGNNSESVDINIKLNTFSNPRTCENFIHFCNGFQKNEKVLQFKDRFFI